ncbi:MAG: ABC transporter ATP-binding protein [Gammaproteobacteria bacterium]|nr:ABC transporter ATP-binding protein [Gammaproteobacteria bacterium]
MSELALTCVGVEKRFHQGSQTLEVLRAVNFSVAAGERVAIVGRSGSGKSTLLHILAGLADPDAGDVAILGESLTAASTAQRARIRNARMGFVYQFHHLLPEFTALENVAMPLLVARVPMREAQKRAQELLASVGLSDRSTHHPSELSGGERQRVAVARALSPNPVVVLADEPTGNLDKLSAAGVLNALNALVASAGTAIVLVTHDESIAGSVDRVLTLEDGVLVE